MGYPDAWTELGAKESNGLNNYSSGLNLVPISDTQRYKTLGNGIVSNVVAEVVRKLYE